VQSLTDDHVASRISKCAGQRLCECCFIEPFVWTARTGVRVADKIGSIVEFSRAAGIHAQKRCDRQAALTGVNPAHLPTINQPFWQGPNQAWEKAQVVHSVDGDSMPQVETGQSSFPMEIVTVLRIRYAACSGIDSVRRIVERLRPGVSPIEVESGPDLLLDRCLQCVVTGIGRRFEIVDERDFRELGVERASLLACCGRAGGRLIEVAYPEEFHALRTDI